MTSGWTLLALCVAFGVLVGVGSGLLGVGGGIFMVPFLVHVGGFEQHAAAATSLLVILPTAISGTANLRGKGVGDLGTGLRLGALGAAGSFGGALLALELPEGVLRVLFAVLLAVSGVRLVRDAMRMPARGHETAAPAR